MAKGFRHGPGGAELNFRVVGGTEQPAHPGENTIWVNTDAAVSGWCFGAKEPEEAAAGLLWICTDEKSAIGFNALKRNGITLRPSGAKQYADGSWQDRQARIWQNGAWVEWSSGELFRLGNTYPTVTGGWENKAIPLNDETPGKNMLTVTENGDGSWTLTNKSLSCGILHTANKIDLTNYTQLCMEGSIYETGYAYCQMAIWSAIGANAGSNRVASVAKTADDYAQLDVSNLSGKYYIGFLVFNNNPGIILRKLWLK